MLDSSSQCWIEYLGRIKAPGGLLALDNLSVKHVEVAFSCSTHATAHYVELDLLHLRWKADFHGDFVFWQELSLVATAASICTLRIGYL